jgi:hypothetical protein
MRYNIPFFIILIGFILTSTSSFSQNKYLENAYDAIVSNKQDKSNEYLASFIEKGGDPSSSLYIFVSSYEVMFFSSDPIKLKEAIDRMLKIEIESLQETFFCENIDNCKEKLQSHISFGQSKLLTIILTFENYEILSTYLVSFETDSHSQNQIRQRIQELRWISAKAKHLQSEYAAFIEEFPNSPKLDSAYFFIESIDWRASLNDNNLKSYQTFTDKYPNSKKLDSVKIMLSKVPFQFSVLDVNSNLNITTETDLIDYGKELRVKYKTSSSAENKFTVEDVFFKGKRTLVKINKYSYAIVSSTDGVILHELNNCERVVVHENSESLIYIQDKNVKIYSLLDKSDKVLFELDESEILSFRLIGDCIYVIQNYNNQQKENHEIVYSLEKNQIVHDAIILKPKETLITNVIPKIENKSISDYTNTLPNNEIAKLVRLLSVFGDKLFVGKPLEDGKINMVIVDTELPFSSSFYLINSTAGVITEDGFLHFKKIDEITSNEEEIKFIDVNAFSINGDIFSIQYRDDDQRQMVACVTTSPYWYENYQGIEGHLNFLVDEMLLNKNLEHIGIYLEANYSLPSAGFLKYDTGKIMLSSTRGNQQVPDLICMDAKEYDTGDGPGELNISIDGSFSDFIEIRRQQEKKRIDKYNSESSNFDSEEDIHKRINQYNIDNSHYRSIDNFMDSMEVTLSENKEEHTFDSKLIFNEANYSVNDQIWRLELDNPFGGSEFILNYPITKEEAKILSQKKFSNISVKVVYQKHLLTLDYEPYYCEIVKDGQSEFFYIPLSSRILLDNLSKIDNRYYTSINPKIDPVIFERFVSVGLQGFYFDYTEGVILRNIDNQSVNMILPLDSWMRITCCPEKTNNGDETQIGLYLSDSRYSVNLNTPNCNEFIVYECTSNNLKKVYTSKAGCVNVEDKDSLPTWANEIEVGEYFSLSPNRKYLAVVKDGTLVVYSENSCLLRIHDVKTTTIYWDKTSTFLGCGMDIFDVRFLEQFRKIVAE